MRRYLLFLTAVLAATIPAHSAETDASSFHCESGVEIPEWRETSPGTAWLGPDVLWRLRDTVVFHLLDQEGGGFGFDLTVRDMNTYQQGPRPVMVLVVGPGDRILLNEIIEDDGVYAGNERYRDGLYHPAHDAMYRRWHSMFTPGGLPEGKERSPFLEHPEKIAPRRFHFEIPDAGQGLYRVVVTGSLDHWVTLTPDRPMVAGIHPGTGPLYVHKDRLEEAWIYVPPTVANLRWRIEEEIPPFHWTGSLFNEDGDQVDEVGGEQFRAHSRQRMREETESEVYRLSIQGQHPGAWLYVSGPSFVLTPDPETARLLHGGAEVDEKGRTTYHHHQRVLNEWVDSLQPEDLEVRRLSEEELASLNRRLRQRIERVYEFLDGQNLDPDSEEFGYFEQISREAHWQGPLALLGLLTYDQKRNPYYGDPALIRRLLLGRIHPKRAFSESYFWPRGDSAPGGFYDFMPEHHKVQKHYASVREMMKESLPEPVFNALATQLELGFLARQLQHRGWSSNKWSMNLHHMYKLAEFLDEPEYYESVHRQLRRLLTPGLLGRNNPDSSPVPSSAGYTSRTDYGATGAQHLGEHHGFDITYTAHAERHMSSLWLDTRDTPMGDLLEENYFKPTYDLLSYLSLPREGVLPEEWKSRTFTNSAVPRIRQTAWVDLVAPTDFAARERGSSFKSSLPAEAMDRIPYADLWIDPAQAETTWPALRPKPFVRVIDDTFYFIKTPAYYSIHYGGATSPRWSRFGLRQQVAGGRDLVGYAGGTRELLQRQPGKPGGLSAVFVENCGPTLFGINRDVMYANVAWGRLKEPIQEEDHPDVDIYLDSGTFVDPRTTFHEKDRLYRKHLSWEHAPIEEMRTIRFRDDRIEVGVELTSMSELSLRDLFETIPFVAEGRTLVLLDEEGRAAREMDPMQDLKGKNEVLEGRYSGLQILAPTGAGVVIFFDKPYQLRAAEPFAFRGDDRPPPTASLSLVLAPEMEAGGTQPVGYQIIPRQERPTPEWLQKHSAAWMAR